MAVQVYKMDPAYKMLVEYGILIEKGVLILASEKHRTRLISRTFTKGTIEKPISPPTKAHTVPDLGLESNQM